MLVGIGVRLHLPNKTIDDEIALREIGCERVFIEENPLAIGNQVQQFEQYLRAGDVVAVTELNRLGRSLEIIVETVDRLHNAKIFVRVEGEGVVPGTGLGDAFGLICARLSAELRKLRANDEQQHTRGQRQRGRPSALTPEMKARAEHFLKQQKGSVLEIARLLHVSPATIYRYFPARTTGGKGTRRK